MLGVIVVPLGKNDKGISAAELVKNREAISQLAQSSDAQKLMSMLRQHGEVQEAAKEHGIPFKAIHVTEKEMAQNVPAPVTTYALFRDGKFVTQGIQSDKKFLKLAGAAD